MPDSCKTPRTPAWLAWFMGRLGYGLLTAWVISLVVFIATQALPSDPARVILGPDAPLESIQTLREQLGLNRPILLQYLSWLGQVLHGDLGIDAAEGLVFFDQQGAVRLADGGEDGLLVERTNRTEVDDLNARIHDRLIEIGTIEPASVVSLNSMSVTNSWIARMKKAMTSRNT